MTTIAFKDGWLVGDSLMLEGEQRSGYVNKLYKLHHGWAGVAGQADCRDILGLLRKATPDNMPTREDLAELNTCGGAVVIFTKEKRVFLVDAAADGQKDQLQSCSVVELDMKQTKWIAIGSGAPYATGVMAYGGSAEEGVEIASRYDSGTGGELNMIKVF